MTIIFRCCSAKSALLRLYPGAKVWSGDHWKIGLHARTANATATTNDASSVTVTAPFKSGHKENYYFSLNPPHTKPKTTIRQGKNSIGIDGTHNKCYSEMEVRSYVL